VTTSATAAAAAQEAEGFVAADEVTPLLQSEYERIAKLRARLTMSTDPELTRQVLEHLATERYAVEREAFERSRGPEAAAALQALLDMGLATTITSGWKTRVRPSHLVDSPQIYEEPETLRRVAARPVRVPAERVTYHPDCGFVLNVEGPVQTCIDWGIAALVGRKEGGYVVVVPHRTRFALTSREELAAAGKFTVQPTAVFKALPWRRIRTGVRCVKRVDPKHVIPGSPQRALA
jgi:hypothetical protein